MARTPSFTFGLALTYLLLLFFATFVNAHGGETLASDNGMDMDASSNTPSASVTPPAGVAVAAAAATSLSTSTHSDDDASSSMDMSMGQMMPFLHTTPGKDTIWIEGWIPSTPGAIVGACIGLFFLAMVERLLAALRGAVEGHWRRRAQAFHENQMNHVENGFSSTATLTSTVENTKHHAGHGTVTPLTVKDVLMFRNTPRFTLAHDIPRGVLYMVQTMLGFAFMLVVMTYNVAFILSILVGLGMGEMVFGRYAGVGH